MPVSTQLLHLHERDNIAVLTHDVLAGSLAVYGASRFALRRDLGMGHKIAVQAIAAGADVIKYGCPIGIAACDIAAGDHVHLHNLKSRYTVIEDMEAGQT